MEILGTVEILIFSWVEFLKSLDFSTLAMILEFSVKGSFSMCVSSLQKLSYSCE